MTRFVLRELRLGAIRPLGPKGVPSGIDKHPVADPVLAGPLGLAGDAQADTRHHGGPDKAVHAYPAAHLALWAADLPETAALFRPGGFGENLVVDGATEADICLGDRWQLGGALLEVSQARQPCWKLNLRFGRTDMVQRVQDSGRSGWYFRVLEPGTMAAGDVARLRSRPHPGWSLTRVSHLLYHDRMNRAALGELAALPGLPETWRRLAENRLRSGRVEDWSLRTTAPGDPATG